MVFLLTLSYEADIRPRAMEHSTLSMPLSRRLARSKDGKALIFSSFVGISRLVH